MNADTYARLRALRDEAVAAGDSAQAELCDVATGYRTFAYRREAGRRVRVGRRQALDLCLEALAAADAQREA